MAAKNDITDTDVEDFRRAVDGNWKNETNKNAMDEYQRLSTKTAYYPGQGTPIGMMYVGLKSGGEDGELLEHVGKALRDDELVVFNDLDFNTARLTFNELTPERKDLIIKELGDRLWYLAAMCNELKISLSEVALRNLQKLNDRNKRGVLGGSGDNR